MHHIVSFHPEHRGRWNHPPGRAIQQTLPRQVGVSALAWSHSFAALDY